MTDADIKEKELELKWLKGKSLLEKEGWVVIDTISEDHHKNDRDEAIVFKSPRMTDGYTTTEVTCYNFDIDRLREIECVCAANSRVDKMSNWGGFLGKLKEAAGEFLRKEYLARGESKLTDKQIVEKVLKGMK